MLCSCAVLGSMEKHNDCSELQFAPCYALLASLFLLPPPPLMEEEAALGNIREEEKNKAKSTTILHPILSIP